MLPLNILYFTISPSRGGAEEHLVSLIGELDRSAFRPILACPPLLRDQIQRNLDSGVEIVPIGTKGLFDFRAAAKLAHLLRSRRIDILHSHLFCSSAFASPIGRLAGVRAILETPHVNEGWRRGWIKGSFVVDRFVARFVDGFVAVSHANARYLAGVKGLPAKKIRVIPNGIEPARFTARARPAAAKQCAAGTQASDPVLVCVARLEPQKGHSVLLDAMLRIRAEIPLARLVIVGEGSLRESLECRSRTLGLGDAVRFAGRQENVADWLATAQVAVLPSLYEGLPLAALEALAAEKPLVATSVDGTPEAVIHERTGLTVPPGDSESLAFAILRMLRDPLRARAMAREGRRLVTEKFTLKRQVRDTENLYREIWEKHLTRVALGQACKVPAYSHWRSELP